MREARAGWAERNLPHHTNNYTTSTELSSDEDTDDDEDEEGREQFLSTAEVLNLLDISETTLARRVRKGILTPDRVIRRGSITANFYRRDDVLKLRLRDRQ